MDEGAGMQESVHQAAGDSSRALRAASRGEAASSGNSAPTEQERPLYRKRPIVIEAHQLTHENFWPVYDWIEAGAGVKEWNWDADGRYIDIRTLEGVIRASEGDWIIKGVQGEMYPCKPDIFSETYEPAERPLQSQGREVPTGLTDDEIDALIQQTADPQAFGTMTQRLHRLARAVEAARMVTLTDEQIVDVWQSSEGYRPGQIAQRNAIDFARAIEAAHGIAAPATGQSLTFEAAKPLASSGPDEPTPASLLLLLQQAAEALTDVIGWVPGRAAWHHDAAEKSVERARILAAELRQRIQHGA